jgi:hypothetical protein
LGSPDRSGRSGNQIMSPHYLLDPKSPAIVPKERWYEPPVKP